MRSLKLRIVAASAVFGGAPAVALAQSRDFTWDRVVNIAYGLVQFLFLAGFWIAAIMIAWFGIQMMISGTNATKFNDAKRGLFWAIVGFAIVVGANLIVLTIRRAVGSI